jgi:hypothetical protein
MSSMTTRRGRRRRDGKKMFREEEESSCANQNNGFCMKKGEALMSIGYCRPKEREVFYVDLLRALPCFCFGRRFL